MSNGAHDPVTTRQFNQMRDALNKIANDFFTAEEILGNSMEEYGLEPQEAIQYAYANIQQIAKEAVQGVPDISSNPL